MGTVLQTRDSYYNRRRGGGEKLPIDQVLCQNGNRKNRGLYNTSNSRDGFDVNRNTQYGYKDDYEDICDDVDNIHSQCRENNNDIYNHTESHSRHDLFSFYGYNNQGDVVPLSSEGNSNYIWRGENNNWNQNYNINTDNNGNGNNSQSVSSDMLAQPMHSKGRADRVSPVLPSWHSNHNVKSNTLLMPYEMESHGYLHSLRTTPSPSKAVDFDSYRIRNDAEKTCVHSKNKHVTSNNMENDNKTSRSNSNNNKDSNSTFEKYRYLQHYYQRMDDSYISLPPPPSRHNHLNHYVRPDHMSMSNHTANTDPVINDDECNEKNENCAFWVSQCQQSSYSLSNRPCWQSNFPFEKLYYSDIDSSSSRCTSVSPSSSLSSLSSPSSFSSSLQRPKKTTTNGNSSNSNHYSSTYQQYYQRKRMRTRKFRLNLFMYANLYRKQRRAESGYEIYHNPIEDPDSVYTSFSNPNYFLNRPTSLSTSTNNNKLSNGDETASLEKLSLASDASGHYSDYSSCEPTPTTPDRSLILHKLNSGDEYDDYDDDLAYGDNDIDDDDDGHKGNENRCLLEGSSRSSGDDSGEEAAMMNGGRGGNRANRKTSDGEDPHVYYGIGGLPWSKSKGILGYLEMLEKQAQARDAAQENGCMRRSDDDEDDGDKESDDYDDNKKSMTKSNGDGENPNEQRENEKFEPTTEINSPDSNDSGIQPGDKILSPDCPSDVETSSRSNEQDGGKDQIKADPDKLPDGWQKHEDEDGPYFWHVKSGTIQREPPPPAPPDGPSLCSPRSISLASDTTSTSSNSMPSTPTSVGSVERHLAEFEAQSLHYAAKSLQAMSHPDRRSRDMSGEKSVRFAVRSLGWVRIAEEDLNPERSSKAVNKCIVDLSLGRDDLSDSVARWGDGKELYMDLDMHSLRLVNPTDGVVLNSQPIHSIRVWGVGRDNGRERDFAYVARDRKTRMHMCHVFHCDVQARQIANTLRDICKKIMLERNLHQNAVARLARPTDLPNLEKVGHHNHHGHHSNGEKLSFQNLYNNARFPTPMEEPRKVIRCHYLGVIEVVRPTGRDVLNEAIQNLYYRIPPEKWIFANVAIAPSTITIIENGNCETILEECRVRFLSFMGIAVDNVKLGAFIMHTAQNKFMCHVFHCEPSAGPMCKTIEAACKLRYQKCMDAHPQTNKTGLQAKSIGEFISSGVKAGVQGLKEAKTSAFNGVKSLFKGKNPENS